MKILLPQLEAAVSALLLLLLFSPAQVTSHFAGSNLQPYAFKHVRSPLPRTSNLVCGTTIDKVAISSPALSVAILRGGELVDDAQATFDLELASKILIYLFGAVNAFHGVVLAAVPAWGAKLLDTSGGIEDKDAAYAEEAIGAFALEYGLTGFLAATGLVEPDKAIGYGTLPDLFFLGKNLANGKFKDMGVQKLMSGMTAIAVCSTATILAGKLHLGPVLEILTIVPAIQGTMKYVDPVGAAKKMMGADISQKPVTKVLYRSSGQMKIVSAVLRGSIAFGVKPLRALGYSVFANALLIADSIFIKKSAEDIGKKKALYHQVGALVLALAMGSVFVLAEREE